MMAAELHPSTSGGSAMASAVGNANPELINKLEGGSDEVNFACLIPGVDGVITGSSDRSVRVWQLRDSGQYWPSICHYMTSAVTSVVYHHSLENRRIFVGVETGMISEFSLADDYNRMDHIRDYHAHQSRVTGLYYSAENKWILSVGKDRYFQYHCTESGRRLGGYLCNSWCTSLDYDEAARYVFIGDFSGAITVCKLEGDSGPKFVNSLKGHEGSVQSLHWDGDLGRLFSGSYDAKVFVWDIGGRRGTLYELHGHRQKVTGLSYIGRRKTLMSVGEDSHMVLWDLSIVRLENPEWAESDTCQLCSRPFFWNLRAMYDQKQIGIRQHHCRKCGKAICDGCSTKRCPLPSRGHEFPVRVCENCFINVTEDEKASHAKFIDLKHSVRKFDYDDQRGLLLTVGQDKLVRIWSTRGTL